MCVSRDEVQRQARRRPAEGLRKGEKKWDLLLHARGGERGGVRHKRMRGPMDCSVADGAGLCVFSNPRHARRGESALCVCVCVFVGEITCECVAHRRGWKTNMR